MIDPNNYHYKLSRAQEPTFYTAPSPPGMVPKQFQLAGVEYSLNKRNSLLGDQPGLGKTIQAILISNAIESKWNLVICPASLRLNWEREIWKWSTLRDVSTYPILKAKDGVSFVSNYVILSYNLVSNRGIYDAIMGKLWDHLILDEAHYLKNPQGNVRTNLICAPNGVQSKCGRITMASGTILPNQPIECYNAVRLMNWDAIDKMELDDFKNHYYTTGKGGMVRGPYTKTDPETGEVYWTTGLHWEDNVRNVPCNLDELQYRLRKNIMVRRLKRDVLKELPAKAWHPFPLVANAAVKKALKHQGWERAKTLYELDPDHFNENAKIEGPISTARRLLGEAKAPLVADYIHDLLDSGVEKIVVSAWHISVLDILYKRLNKFGLTYMDGSTSPKKKQEAVDEFNEFEDIRIILGQTQPLGEGWTLTVAQDLVVAEVDWVPGKNEQLLDRIDRMGQEGNYVLGHVPVIPDSMDERIISTAIEKDKNIHKALDAPISL